MSDHSDLAEQQPAPRPSRVSQTTAIEQSRAVAEVQAAAVLAREFPRDVAAANRAMRQACDQISLAERAFFRFARAGSQVTGPSIHLARELARCWGNIQYGISELHRDDVEGMSEMVAFAWDVETNTRSSSGFLVPHRRMTKRGAVALVDPRDVYENNANNASRRVREAIYAVLPRWFSEDAQDRCRATLERGPGDAPFDKQVADLIGAFDGLGVSVAQLERKLARKSGQWTGQDLATLRIIGKSISTGETTTGDEFEPDVIDVTTELGEPS